MQRQDQQSKMLSISEQEFSTIQNPGLRVAVKSLLQIRQALYDNFGNFPQDNILPYAYSFSLTSAKGNAIAANANTSASIKVSADSAFVGVQIVGASSGDYLLFPRTDASDRQLSNEAVHSSAYVGTAERPHYLPKPLFLPANTTISFDLTDLSGAENEVYFTIIGYKVYRGHGA